MVNLGDLNPLKNVSVSGLWHVAIIIFIVGVVGLVAGGIGFFLYKRKKEMKLPKTTICWWEETQDSMIPLDADEAVEIVHPGTRLRAFYIKKKDMWLPRFTRPVKQGLYYVAITPQRELVNWIPGKLSEDMSRAGLKYDHTDMIWAAENLRDFVKRNYRDKGVKWWQAYQQVITTVIYLVFLAICFAIVLYMMRGIVGDIGAIGNQLGEIIKNMEVCKPTSGLVQG